MESCARLIQLSTDLNRRSLALTDRRKSFWPFGRKRTQAPRYRRYSSQPERDRYDWITLYTAILGVIVVAGSTGITAWQAILTREQLNTAISQDRGWLRIDLRHESPMVVSDRGAAIALRIDVTNVGNAPVQKAQGYIRLYPTTASRDVEDPANWVRDVCPADADTTDLGATVFPEEKIEVWAAPIMPSRAEIDVVENSAGIVRFLVTTCVGYLTDDGKTRRTGAIYLVERVGYQPDGNGQNFKSLGDIATKETLEMYRLGAGDIAE